MRLLLSAIVVALVGFIALSLEILWVRVYGFVSAGSPAAFGLLLSAYLLGIALGALVSRRVCGEASSTGQPRHLRALALLLAPAASLATLVVPFTCRVVQVAAWPWSLPAVVLASASLGAVLPLISHFAIAPDGQVGRRLSLLYVANIIGSATGSLVTGFVLMDHLSLGASMLVLLLLGLALALTLFIASDPGRRQLAWGCALWAGLVTSAVLLVPPLYDQAYERLLLKERFFPEARFNFLQESRHGVIATMLASDGSEVVFGDGGYDGKISLDLVHDRNLIVRAYAVAALHPAPRRVLMVGLSGGSWSQVLAHMPGLQRLTVVEINPGYRRLVAARPQVASLLTNPRVELVFDDARRWLSRHPSRRFDVIVQNTTWHWRANVTHLLSRQYLELARSRLRPGGLLLYNTTGSADAIKTGLSLFAHGLLVHGALAVSERSLRFDRRRWAGALRRWRIDGKPVFDLRQPPHRQALATLLSPGWLRRVVRTDPGQHLEQAQVVTDDNMLVEWRTLHLQAR